MIAFAVLAALGGLGRGVAFENVNVEPQEVVSVQTNEETVSSILKNNESLSNCEE
jgi:hypothetical protein